MNPLLSPWFWVAVIILAGSLLAYGYAGHRRPDRRNLPGNLGSDTWPQLDEWEADTEEAITQALRNIADEHTNRVVDFHTPTKDRIAGMIAANHLRRIDLDEEWKKWGSR